jgi:DUF971 family protein
VDCHSTTFIRLSCGGPLQARLAPVFQFSVLTVKLNLETEAHLLLPMPTPIDQRKKPATVKIHVKTGAGVDITWADAHCSHFDFPYLREQCPCATCNDERGNKGDAAGFNLPVSPLLPMYKPKPRAHSAAQVGNYAIQIVFSDGHSTGIYSYDYLRTICPCEECARVFREPSR